MRTTLDLDESLLAELKRLAAETHRTVSAVAEDAIRETLARREVAEPREVAEFAIVNGEGLQPGVTLDDNATLRELLDEGLPLEKRR